MQPSDIAKLATVADPQVSPDGRHVAYAVRRIDAEANTYTSQIWVAAVDGTSRPRALSSGEHLDAQPRWSPDGTQLAFTSTRTSDAAGQTRSTLHLLPFGVPGETVLLAEGADPFVGPTFSPDGNRLAVAQRTRGDHYTKDKPADRPARKVGGIYSTVNGLGFVADRPTHVKVIATDGSGPLHNLTPGPLDCSAPAWLADGSGLVVTVRYFDGRLAGDIGVVSATAPPATDEPPTTTPVELLNDGVGSLERPVLTPAGDQVLVTGWDDMAVTPQNYELALLDLEARDASPRWISRDLDRTWLSGSGVSDPVFVDDTTAVASYDHRGSTHLVAFDITTGTAEVLVGGDLCVTAWSIRTLDDEPVIAYCASTPTRPTELFVLVGGETRQLTDHSAAFAAATNPQPAEHFVATASGAEVDAWIITPPDFDPSQRYPMLFNIHGGPFAQYANSLLDEFQIQAAAGYVVVYSNPRGSSGRGNDWVQAIIGPKHPSQPGPGWGSVDFDDLMSVVDTAIERYPFIDTDRLGVLGGSYGGYMTAWTVTHTDRFAAASAARGVYDLAGLVQSADCGPAFVSQLGADWVDDVAELARMSPVTYIDELSTPLQIIHSEDDLRCPQAQAWLLYRACRARDADVEFWLFPGENHELSRSGSPSHRKQRAEIILEFFNRHLQP